MQPVPLDEHPIHQAPLSLRHVPASDRNFYDRCYYNAHDRTGDIFLITGGGVYPNLGVVDAYATVRRGDTQWSVRCSDAMDERPLDLEVGPYQVEVIEPLKKLRLICDADDHGIGFDLTWDGSHPAVMEQAHLMRKGTRAILDASRFAQLGSWEGVLRVDGEEITVDPETWVGSRDRSWGIRPVGEPETPGRPGGRPERGPLVALRADPLRRPLGDHHLPGEPGRVPHAQRRHPCLGRRPGRPAGLARGRDRLHVGHPHPGAGPHPPHRAGRQGLRHGGREPRLRRPAPRRRLRRRQRLDPRPVAWSRLGGGQGLRPHHRRHRRPASPSA